MCCGTASGATGAESKYLNTAFKRPPPLSPLLLTVYNSLVRRFSCCVSYTVEETVLTAWRRTDFEKLIITIGLTYAGAKLGQHTYRSTR